LELKDSVTGVTRHFDAVHSSHDFGYAKEQPRFWESLARAEPHRPEETLFVDDSAAVLTAAAAAGLPVVAISRPDSREPARPVRGLPAVGGVAELL
ncbi:MAG: HAD-IA family hydrolase, partial [Pseudomonadota bacterium]